jgi:hypothetical protein
MTRNVSIEDATVEITAGLYDTSEGFRAQVEGDDFPRVHISPQGEILTGDGGSEPTPLATGETPQPGYVTPNGDGDADLSAVTDNGVRTVSEYEDFVAGWNLILASPSATAAPVRVLVAATTSISDFGIVAVDTDLDPVPLMIDTVTMSAIATAATLLITFDPVQGLDNSWLYAATGTEFANLD